MNSNNKKLVSSLALLSSLSWASTVSAQADSDTEAPSGEGQAEAEEAPPASADGSDDEEQASSTDDQPEAEESESGSSEDEVSEEDVPDAEEAIEEPAVEDPADYEDPSHENEMDFEDESEEVSDAELERYLQEAQLGDTGFTPKLNISGFADFNYTHFISKNNDPWRILYNNKGQFGVGNLNLYLDGQISETVRAFTEIRFTYLPDGNIESLGAPTEREYNGTSDYTRNERDIRLGGLRIERAWLQWSPHQSFRVKAGHWLTPYGIWNVDHGTPTIVSVTRPFMIDEELLPESQAGILIEGRFDLTDHFALEYGAGISNGRGALDRYYDYDSNKGLTGRLKLLYTGAGELQVGVSGYRGRYTNNDINLTINEDGLSSSDINIYQFDEISAAADIRYTNGGFLFQSEAMLNDRAFTEEGRGSTAGGLTPDNRRWGVYGLSGYRFDWYGVMPYVIGEYSPVPNAGIPELPREVLLLGGGVNIRPIGQVVVKVGYDQALFPENRADSFDQHPIRRMQGQVAWAF